MRCRPSNEANPYQTVYFVDVSVSRVSGKVVSYRVIGDLSPANSSKNG
jgi:hypothetical protein